MVNIWELIGFLRSSNYRLKVLKSLSDKEHTPSEIEKNTGIKISHVSRTLKEITDKKLAECLNPKLRKGKLYKITKLGKSLLNKIQP